MGLSRPVMGLLYLLQVSLLFLIGVLTLSHIKEYVKAKGVQVQEDNDDIWR